MYAVMNGYLDGISVDKVQQYEIELYDCLEKSIFYIPFDCSLRSNLNEVLLASFLSLFSDFFIKNF